MSATNSFSRWTRDFCQNFDTNANANKGTTFTSFGTISSMDGTEDITLTGCRRSNAGFGSGVDISYLLTNTIIHRPNVSCGFCFNNKTKKIGIYLNGALIKSDMHTASWNIFFC